MSLNIYIILDGQEIDVIQTPTDVSRKIMADLGSVVKNKEQFNLVFERYLAYIKEIANEYYDLDWYQHHTNTIINKIKTSTTFEIGIS